jgi:hypothetical protein
MGKGPSAMTVDSPLSGVKLGDSLTIRGTVTDISPGTQQEPIRLRFPNGVPAVSDASQSEMMQYIYYQQQKPMNATGVAIPVSVLDLNNNYRTIGTVTSDKDGFFSLNWKPDIPGQYIVYASFDGSESYWPSHAETSFAVDPVAETQTSPSPLPIQSVSDQYFLPAIAAIILAITIDFAVTILVLKKRQ